MSPPNGVRYPLVGWTRQRQFDGTNLKPHKLLENAQTPTTTAPVLFRGSGARCVSRTHGTPAFLIDNEHQTHFDQIVPTTKILAITKKDHDEPKPLQTELPIK